MSRKYAQLKKTTLSYGISDSETSMRFTGLKKLDGTSISASDIGDYMTLTFDPGTSKEEIASITSSDVTVNTDGTVDVVNVVRGLLEVDPYTTGGYACEHGAGAVVVFSNNPQLYNQLANKSNANTFSQQNIFNSYAPQTDTDPTNPNDLTRLSYVQALVLGTLTTINVIVPGKAGETISGAGKSVYFDETDNEWKLTDADDATKSNNVLLGISQGAGTDGNPITNGVLLQGVDDNQSGLVEGDVEYISNTAGAISSTPGTTEVTVGIAKSATELYFNPRFNQQLTEDQQDALAQSESPSVTNAFITQTRFQKNSEKYAADAGANDTYVVTLSPVPTSYTNGMVVYFKANTANTGTATLNVNSLGAKTIVKGVNTTLADSDILAGQFCTVIYDGTNFVLQNPVSTNVANNPLFKSGATTYDLSTASGTQNIAHGLGITPKWIKVTYFITWSNVSALPYPFRNGVTSFNGTTYTGWYVGSKSGETSTVYSSLYTTSSNLIEYHIGGGGSSSSQTATASLDATNIVLTWTKTSTPTGTLTIQWEAFA